MINLNNILADLLEKLAANIRSGNCNITSNELDLITECINSSTNFTRELGTDEVIRFLNISRNDFYDNYKDRLNGIKRAGQKTIYYTKKDVAALRDKMKEENCSCDCPCQGRRKFDKD